MLISEALDTDWAMLRGQYVRIHGAVKAGRLLIEGQSKIYENEVFREWVKPESLTKIDPAVSSILESIYNY